MKVVIDRNTWLRGDPDDSSLLRSDGKMCCLGFAALAAGLSTKQIAGRGDPTSIDLPYKGLPESLALLVAYPSGTSRVCNDLIEANDEPGPFQFEGKSDPAYEAEREAKIIKFGLEAGLEFEFIN